VTISGQYSEWVDVSSGVPQGSILGPLLFAIFVNDLDNKLINNILQFADDTKMWGKVNTVEEVQSMQKDLSTLTE